MRDDCTTPPTTTNHYQPGPPSTSIHYPPSIVQWHPHHCTHQHWHHPPKARRLPSAALRCFIGVTALALAGAGAGAAIACTRRHGTAPTALTSSLTTQSLACAYAYPDQLTYPATPKSALQPIQLSPRASLPADFSRQSSCVSSPLSQFSSIYLCILRFFDSFTLTRTTIVCCLQPRPALLRCGCLPPVDPLSVAARSHIRPNTSCLTLRALSHTSTAAYTFSW